MWKGYDNPADILAAAAGSIECNEDLATAAHDLTEFVATLDLEPEQSLTVVAHSFGSIVVGAALADAGLKVTDVVVAGSPGMTVDGLRQLHLEQSHFFSEQAPGDAVAELGVFGAVAGLAEVRRHADGHERAGSPAGRGALALLRAGLRRAGEHGRRRHRASTTDILRHRAAFPEIAGGLVAWALRMPVAPLRVAGRHYRGPGFRVLTNWCRLVDLGASETGNLVCEVLDESERALLWFAHRVGAVPRHVAEAAAEREPGLGRRRGRTRLRSLTSPEPDGDDRPSGEAILT